mgnify:CR=1 FL=1
MAEEVQNTDQKSSYRRIFKATSLFGGVQVYQILIQIIKSKFVAILLGPSGFGIAGLYQSAIDLVKQVTSLGISQSAVRDVSEANGTGDIKRISRTVTVLRKIVWWTGMFGLIAVVALSPILSKTSFGNYDYTIPFIVLSVTLLLDQLCAGQRVVLQGMRRLRDLAKCSAIGVTLGLVITVPLYYLFGVDGIVPTMVLNAGASFVIAWIYARKVKLEPVEVTPKETFAEGKNMMTMGLAMSLSGILGMGVAFALRSYIRSIGGTEEVGLYQAGFAIITSYVGLVFSAIGTDYYPRLAAVNKDNQKCKEIICQQGEIGVLILAPMLTICIVFMPILIKILYADSFLAANVFILWCCLGMMFRMASWVISFVFVAKSESKLFIINEFSANTYNLVLSIICYKLWGLTGLGIAFAAEYLVYFVQVFVIAYKRYKFKFNSSFLRIFLSQLLLVSICLTIVFITEGWLKYLLGTILILVCSIESYLVLDEKIGIKEYVNRIIKRGNK